MASHLARDPVATDFPDGHYDFLPHQAWLWTDAVLGSQEGGILPSTICLIAFNGAGVSIQGLMDALQTAPRDVLFGEIAIETERPLVPGRYRITTRITGIERKQGRRIPLFDRVSIEQRLIGADSGDHAAAVRQLWVVTRQGDAA